MALLFCIDASTVIDVSSGEFQKSTNYHCTKVTQIIIFSCFFTEFEAARGT